MPGLLLRTAAVSARISPSHVLKARRMFAQPVVPPVPEHRNRLPYDLEREIIEFAAHCFPGFAPTLALVSRRAQAWVEAIIYHTIVLDFPLLTTILFLRTVDARPAGFFSKRVKNLCITTMVPYSHAQRVLAVCTNLDSLTCWTDGILPFLTVRENPPVAHSLQRLSIKLGEMQGRTGGYGQPYRDSSFLRSLFKLPVFQRLTHLDVVHPPAGVTAEDWTSILSLPALTHLSLGDLGIAQHHTLLPALVPILDESPTLEVLVLISSQHLFRLSLKALDVRDPRLVVLSQFHEGSSVKEYWESVRRGERDFWTLPEDLVKIRRKEGTYDPIWA
ncbi:hypothetical protein BDN72DRAFT_846253 [Pluteus cervinus]|uniref:Uncharacterized protein n=1 Tax=Pluteus cervinus TaxID=181527 RepID=A0ACD3AHK3_9AGAR|nr:hypothetical protein BDN72DRAFT_846253 [Pluteus cervinus]